jgi:MFS transporter, DHA1 family, multidrug resistance protein
MGPVKSEESSGSVDQTASALESDNSLVDPESGFPSSSLGDEKLYLVEFSGPEDPLHPKNWPVYKTILNSVIGIYAMTTLAFGSSFYAPAAMFIAEEFHVSDEVAILGIAVYVMGFATGPLLWGPMSDFYGRRPVLLFSLFGFMIFSFAVAVAKDIQTVIISRFFAGAIGSAPLAVVPASFSESINFRWLGITMSILIASVFAGPTVAPSVGAFICTSHLGWRWTHYILGIMVALGLVTFYFGFTETLPQKVLTAKAIRLRKETGNWAIHSKLEATDLTLASVTATSLKRVFIMLTTEPIIILVGIYVSFVYSMLYLCLEAFPLVFIEKYRMGYGVGNLPYIAVTVGLLLSSILFALLERRYVAEVARTGKLNPNKRLENMMIPSIVLPIGFFWFFWTANYHDHIHWIIPTIGAVFIGFGLIGVFLAAILYTVETYLPIAAVAVAANTFMRSITAGVFPLFAKQLFDNIGLQWGGTLLGCLAIAMIPIPVLFRIYSKGLNERKRSSF